MRKGDSVSFKGRQGTVVGFMPGEMVDVRFDGGRVERRRKDLLSSARSNPRKTRRARKNQDLDSDVKSKVSEGGGLTVFTRPDPPRLSPPSAQGQEYCGNPIDGTAYYALVSDSSRTVDHWVVKSDLQPYLSPEAWSYLGWSLKGEPVPQTVVVSAPGYQSGYYRERNPFYEEISEALDDYRKDAVGRSKKLRWTVKREAREITFRQRKGSKAQRGLKLEQMKEGTSRRKPRAQTPGAVRPPATAVAMEVGGKWSPYPARPDRFLKELTEPTVEYYQVSRTGASYKDRLNQFSVYGQKFLSVSEEVYKAIRQEGKSFPFGGFADLLSIASEDKISPQVAAMIIRSGGFAIKGKGDYGFKRFLNPSDLKALAAVRPGDTLRVSLPAKDNSPYFSWVRADVSPFTQTQKGYTQCAGGDQKEVQNYVAKMRKALGTYSAALQSIRTSLQGLATEDSRPIKSQPLSTLRKLASSYAWIVSQWDSIEIAAQAGTPSAVEAMQLLSPIGLGDAHSPIGSSIESLRGIFVVESGEKSKLVKVAAGSAEAEGVWRNLIEQTQRDGFIQLGESTRKKQLPAMDKFYSEEQKYKTGYRPAHKRVIAGKEVRVGPMTPYKTDIPLPRTVIPFTAPTAWTEKQDQVWAVQTLLEVGRAATLKRKGWTRRERVKWDDQVHALLFAYYALGGYKLVGALNPIAPPPKVVSDTRTPICRGGAPLKGCIQLLENIEAGLLGGSTSLNRARLGVTGYVTYNPILFEITRLFWRSDFSPLQHSKVVQDIDTMGRYGFALQAFQVASRINPSLHDVRLHLEDMFLPAEGVPLHIMLRATDKGKKASYIPFLLFWPLGFVRKVALSEADDFVHHPIEKLKSLKAEASRAVTTALAVRTRTKPIRVDVTPQEKETPFVFTGAIDEKKGKSAHPGIYEKRDEDGKLLKGSVLAFAEDKRKALATLIDQVDLALAKEGIGDVKLLPKRLSEATWEEEEVVAGPRVSTLDSLLRGGRHDLIEQLKKGSMTSLQVLKQLERERKKEESRPRKTGKTRIKPTVKGVTLAQFLGANLIERQLILSNLPPEEKKRLAGALKIKGRSKMTAKRLEQALLSVSKSSYRVT